MQNADRTGRRRRWLRFFAWSVVVLALLVVAAVLALPAILTHVDLPAVEIDLAEKLTPFQRSLVRGTSAALKFKLSKGGARDFDVAGRGRILDWPCTVEGAADYSLLGLSAEGEATLRFDDTPWLAKIRFQWSARGGWTAAVAVPETRFDEADGIVGALARRACGGSVTNLVFSGTAAVDVAASATNAIPEWTVSARIAGLDADFEAGETPVSLRKLRVRGGASGYGGRTVLAPMFPRADEIVAAGISLSNAFASVRSTESAWLVTEAGAGICGGEARLYALFLDPERMNAGFTLFLDDIDAGQVLGRISGFRGEATGRLHGKLPLKLRNGSEISLGDAFLYSVPGETGTIRAENGTEMAERLAAAGVAKADRDNLARVLENLDYTALRISLRREDGDHVLAMLLEGSATRGKTTVPVSIRPTIRGDLEQLVNAGLKATGRKGSVK